MRASFTGVLLFLAAIAATFVLLCDGSRSERVSRGDDPGEGRPAAAPLEGSSRPAASAEAHVRAPASFGVRLELVDECGLGVVAVLGSEAGVVHEIRLSGDTSKDLPGPGRYLLEVREDRYHRSQRIALSLSEEEPWSEVELVVQHRRAIPVLVLASDGRPLSEAYRSRNALLPNRPRVLVSGELPGAVGSRLARDFHTRPAPAVIVSCAAATPGMIGKLDLVDSQPVFLALVLGDVLLDVLRVNGDEESLHLRANELGLEGMLGSISFRALGDEGALSGVSGYGLRALGSRNTLIRVRMDAEGRGSCRDLAPGSYQFCLQVDGYAFFSELVELAAGQHVDLGDITLEPGVLIQGVVVDETGAPVPAEVRFFSADDPRLEVGVHSVLASPGDTPGWFAVGELPPGPLRCQVQGDEWALNPVTIMASGPVMEDLFIQAQRGQAVTLSAAADSADVWSIRSDQGEFVWQGRVAAQMTLRLLSGHYRVAREGAEPGEVLDLVVREAPVTLEL